METDSRTERERALQAGRVGELGLSIAHEVNQPLAAISLHAAAARKWLHRSEPDIERALSSLSLISAAGQHAGDIVRSVQCLASRKAHEMGSVPMDQTIIDTLRLLRRSLRRHGIEVELALGLGDCAIHASRVQLQQVLTNLLVNATEALAGSGADSPARRIRIQSRRCGEHEIEVAVSDNGPGIPPEHAGRVFGSLFSTKPNSTGMGLSISLAIVRAHRGHIDYEPCRPHGACFRFRLPVQCSHP
jgi:C4-dicarboxylate-specific signal transduction histidine kinase